MEGFAYSLPLSCSSSSRLLDGMTILLVGTVGMSILLAGGGPLMERDCGVCLSDARAAASFVLLEVDLSTRFALDVKSGLVDCSILSKFALSPLCVVVPCAATVVAEASTG